ncbi:MAG: hypothetical protein R2788_21570 [Saprospiraceae bacterium]
MVKYWNKEIYEYDRQRFNYDYFLPLPSISYSRYTGFGIGVSGSWTHRNFTKDEYQSKHKVNVGYTTEGNLSVGLGRFHQAVQRWDFLINGFVAQPQLQNRFYGIGNSSVNNDDELGTRYYETAVHTQHFFHWPCPLVLAKSSFQVTAVSRITPVAWPIPFWMKMR